MSTYASPLWTIGGTSSSIGLGILASTSESPLLRQWFASNHSTSSSTPWQCICLVVASLIAGMAAGDGQSRSRGWACEPSWCSSASHHGVCSGRGTGSCASRHRSVDGRRTETAIGGDRGSHAIRRRRGWRVVHRSRAGKPQLTLIVFTIGFGAALSEGVS